MDKSESVSLASRCRELEELLKESREEAQYYKNIASVTGRRRLKEVDQLSNLIALRQKAEQDLKKAHDGLEEQVEERTRELLAINEQLKNEIDERKRAKILTTQTQLLQNILSTIPHSVFWKDRDFVYRGCNDNFIRDAGLASSEDIIGKTDYDLPWKKEESDFFRQCDQEVMETGAPMLDIEESQHQASGKETTLLTSKVPLVADSGKIDGVLGIYTDITERKNLEIELNRAKKLESLGVLAGGIAHDFNNYLLAILGNISLTKTYLNPNVETYELLEQSENACFRAKGLTQQLLTFSKGGEPVMNIMAVKDLLLECIRFVLSGSNVRADFSIEDDLWSINGDKGQIAQVIQNILSNADHVMSSGGVINVSAQNVLVTEQDYSLLKAGKYIKIAIRDEGPGINAENLEKIFDPYFSTKAKGSGLGMTICHSIVQKHGGSISIKSEMGKGTTFYIVLPAVEEKVAPVEKKEDLVIGTGRILLMDDEPMVTAIATRMLKHIGYDVDQTCDGKEAIELYRKAMESEKPFDAVIFDLTIPGGMGGKDAIQELRKIDQQVKAIVSSGFSEDPVLSDYEEYGFSAVLPKPFTIAKLSNTLGTLLGKK